MRTFRHSCVLLLLCLYWASGQELSEAEKNNLMKLFPMPTTTEGSINLSPTKKTTSRNGMTQTELDRLIKLGLINQTTATTATTASPIDKADPGNNTECETMDKKKGVCVLHYQCNPDTGTVVTDGSYILDMRLRDCPHYLQVCCQLAETREKPTPPPVVDRGCGWTNPGAQAFRTSNSEQGTAEFGDFPWMVAIMRRSDASAWSHSDYLGGGSIIHPSVVLTAAHKVDGKEAKELKCRAGEWDTQTDLEIYPHQERNVKKKVQHEDFYRTSVYNSVALLFLESPYDFSEAPHMGVACVAPQPPAEGAPCYSMGWGKDFTNKEKYAVVLKKVQLPMVSRDKCQKALRSTRLGSYFELHTSLTCAGGVAGKDTCLGDGGSPLVCPIGPVKPKKDAERYEISGMVAWGIGCGDAVPGVYVNVPPFRDWLAQRMREEGYDTSSYTAQ